jgi:hypothetical protein
LRMRVLYFSSKVAGATTSRRMKLVGYETDWRFTKNCSSMDLVHIRNKIKIFNHYSFARNWEISKIRLASVVNENKSNGECTIKNRLILKICYSISQFPFISYLKMGRKCCTDGTITGSTVCSPVSVSSASRHFPNKMLINIRQTQKLIFNICGSEHHAL